MKYVVIMIFALVATLEPLVAQDVKPKVDTIYAEEDLYEDDPYFWSFTKEVGINFTPLISKFVPFNLGNNSAGDIGIRWKKYYSKRAFRFNFGANFDDISSEGEDNFLFLSLGVEKRHPISKDKKIFYTSGWDGFLRVTDDNGTVGASKIYGFEYHFTKRIFISTEGALNIGFISDSGINLEFMLPVAIFVNVRLY